MHLIRLKFSILATITGIIGLSTLFVAILLRLTGSFNIYFTILIVLFFNLIQWLYAPKMIESLYRMKEVTRNDEPRLHELTKRICDKAKFPIPKIMIANMPIPNAFAYGSPISGNRIAVTTELTKILEEEEVEAVLAHEVGHLKHKDVQVMMFASVLPAIFYYIGISFMFSSMWGNRRTNSGNGIAIGIVSMALYWILTLGVMRLSRLREYYADQMAINNVDDGSRKLSEALAKITIHSGKYKLKNRNTGKTSSFKSLFISDPDRSEKDEVLIAKSGIGQCDQKLVKDILQRKITVRDRIMEALSTHPNIVKRLKAINN